MEKINPYNLLATLLPGTLLVALLGVLFPGLSVMGKLVRFPDSYMFLVLLSLSVLIGVLIQSVASFFEPYIFKLFGGRPGARALSGQLPSRYFPADSAKPIIVLLQEKFGGESSHESLFLRAMSLAETSTDSKVANFNAQYALHRSLFTSSLLSVLLGLGSRFCAGSAGDWTSKAFWITEALMVGISILLAWRTWQRSAYYAREVLFSAERILLQLTSTLPGAPKP